jgi:dolichol-phosphate mannosyltransferase
MKWKYLELTAAMKDKLLEFIKFTASSLASTTVDLGLFALLVFLLRNIGPEYYIFISTVIARIVSLLVNYNINAQLVFEEEEDRNFPFIKYISLALAEMLLSALLVYLLATNIELNETLAKMLVDGALFFAGYLIQRNFIFK